jgi:lipoprotein-anchoring transpeptidase ErfK/SrfK
LVDKSQQRLWVYEDGVETGSWLVSTGLEKQKCAPSRCYIARTPTGQWTPKRMFYTYTSQLWNARMDRAIFFTGGIALHATYGENIAKLGTKASGGCVRQSPENADKLFRLVKSYGMGNTLIRIQN